MKFRSALFIGAVTHRRLWPRIHKFRYRAFWMLADLDELPDLDSGLHLFSRNGFNLFGLRETDHGDGSTTPLRRQAERQLARVGIDLKGGAIRLFCMPRTLGYCFNPLSIYFCHNADGSMAALLYEVHNTFGQRHIYVIPVRSQSCGIHQRCEKTFYVSPFMDMDMRYEFRVTGPAENISVAIRASMGGRLILSACLVGARRELSDQALIRLFLTIPAVTLKVVVAIHWEALRLWLKGLRLRRQPPPPDSIITISPSSSKNIASVLLRHMIQRIECGQLVVDTPGGECFALGGSRPGPQAQLTIHRWNCLWRLLTGWDIGFAQSYMAGEWSSPNLPELLNLATRNFSAAASMRALRLPRLPLNLRHALNRNSRRGSRRNIAAHYDLGNDFFAHWLDPGMTYSSGLYSSAYQTLEDAQQAKLRRVIDLLAISGGERVLEIGCGWGSLIEQMLAQHGCTVTGLTLSTEQLTYARTRLQRLRLRKQCDLRLEDYRDAHGQYDRVASIEMLEAVGEAYWPTFFAKLRELLRPRGMAVLQVITIDEKRFEYYRRRPDFVQGYIFPGGMLPTVEIIEHEIAQAQMRLVSAEFFGDSYARTLAEWRRRFEKSWPSIQTLGFDSRFKRMWEYYLAYCQAGFEAGSLNVGFYQLART